ncbi:ABC transporter substrate-binding protein [Thalassotalea aquiviva]|uniref:ABC transporter substrate-binding protein n=1 Tax=Thalassotalea aquiviva TaxID=3242415 RepID=UPI00352B4C38
MNLNKLKQYIGLPCLAGLISLLLGCDNIQNDSVLSEGVVYCSEGAPTSFNPQLITSATTVDATSNQIYNRLIDLDSDQFEQIPALAKSWQVSDDGLSITFYLRQDVSFHTTSYFKPTRKMNADDVIFSFERILNANNPFYLSVAGKFPFFKSVNFESLVKSVNKLDEHTVQFTLNQPNSTFLANVAAPFSVILSKEYADSLLAQNNNKVLSQLDSLPVGTGPYIFKEYKDKAIIRYVKNPVYWRQDVQIEQLIFSITPNNTGRLTKLLTHECDVISYPIATQKINSRPDLVLEKVTSFNVAFLAFNTQQPPFDNPLVRKAIAHAINKDVIISSVYFDQAQEADSLLPTESWGYSDQINKLAYSKDIAKDLLADAGLEDGFSFDIWAMPVQRAYNPNALKMAKLIKADLAQIGVDVNIVTFEWATFLRKLAKGEHQSVLIGWSADHPDPDNFFSPLLSCSSLETGSNRAFWCNKEFDSLIESSLLTNHRTSRKALYLKAQNIILEDVPLLPIAHAKRAQAKVDYIHGKILTPFGGISFEDVRKDKK